MKKFLKMAALMLLAGALVVGFASCSNGSDDSSSKTTLGGVTKASLGNVVATFKHNNTSKKQKIFLFDTNKAALSDAEAEANGVTDGIRKTGTYTQVGSDFSDVTVTWKKQLNTNGTWEDKTETQQLPNSDWTKQN